MYKKIFQELEITKEANEDSKLRNLMKIPKKEKGKNRPTIQNFEKNSIHQADLLFLPNDDGYKYALVVVDTSTGMCDARPLKTKQNKEVLKAFKAIYRGKYLKIPFSRIGVDSGSEFKGVVRKYFEDNGAFMKVGRTGRHRQVAMAESLNKIIGRSLHARMNAEQIRTGEISREWVEFLPKVIQVINEYRKKRKMKSGKYKDPKCEGKSCEILPIGTRVRVILEEPIEAGVERKKLHGKFRAGDIRWENKIRKIEDHILIPNQPPMYKISGIEKVQGYTREQLQVVGKDEKMPHKTQKYVIEKLVRRRKIRGRIMFEVKWKGYRKTTLEPRSQLMKDVPDMVRAFERK